MTIRHIGTERPSLNDNMIEVALVISKRGTCAKKQVGCVITDKYGRIIATGYNGQARGMTHCTHKDPCPAYADPSISCKAIHAEINALVHCTRFDDIYGVYITEEPCEKCLLTIRNTPAQWLFVLSKDLTVKAKRIGERDDMGYAYRVPQPKEGKTPSVRWGDLRPKSDD